MDIRSHQWRIIGVFAILGLWLLPFQNCGKQFMGEISLLSQCNEETLQIFNSQIHPFLKAHCKECHVNGPGAGRFAQDDPLGAYIEFKDRWQAVIQNATGNHRPPNTGSHRLHEVNQWREAYEKATHEALLCEIAQSSQDPLAVPVITATRLLPVNNSETILEWDLRTDVTLPAQKNRIPASIRMTLKAQWQLNNSSGPAIDIEMIRNPEIRLHQPNVTVSFDSLMLTVETKIVPGFTRWKQMSQEGRNFWSGTNWQYLTDDRSLLPVRFELGSSQSSLPVNVKVGLQLSPVLVLGGNQTGGNNGGSGGSNDFITWTQLTGTGPRAVFTNRCIRCHGNNRQDGGLNLQDYNDAYLRAERIIIRMRNGSMPPGGGLAPEEIQWVEQWISFGRPR